jgi:hypothetical protein
MSSTEKAVPDSGNAGVSGAASAPLKDKFKRFYIKRDLAKTWIYSLAFWFGAVLAVGGWGSAAILWGLPRLELDFSVQIAVRVLGTAGFVVVASIPTDKLCFDTSISPAVKVALRLVLSIAHVLWLSLSIPDTGAAWRTRDILSVTLFAVGAAVTLLTTPLEERRAARAALVCLRVVDVPPKGDVPQNEAENVSSAPIPYPTGWSLVTTSYTSTAMLLFLWFVTIQVAGGYSIYLYNLACCTDHRDPGWLRATFTNTVWVTLWGFAVLLPPAFFLRIAWSRKGMAEPSGWRTDVLYQCACGAIGAVSAGFLNEQIQQALLDGPMGAELTRNIVLNTLMLAAALLRPFGGSRLAFLAFARLVETSRKAMRKEGAELAALVTQTDRVNWAARSHWVKRKTPVPGDSPLEEDTVNRRFWMMGHIVARRDKGDYNFKPEERDLDELRQQRHDQLYLRVKFLEDMDSSWTARYVGTRLDVTKRAQSAGAAGTVFDSWRASNFPNDGEETDGFCEVDYEERVEEGGYVVVRVSVSGERKDAEEIMDASKSSLRQFTPSWNEKLTEKYFYPDLLKVSPREVQEASKKGIYNMSEEASPDRGIDFFLSHSWDEQDEKDRTRKYEVLRSFLQDRAPASLWFDKTCLDTMDTKAKANAIAALPIFTGTCKRVIVLLSPTYLRRLWCVWELQCVFTFALRELATERIVLLCAGGDPNEALTWSLDRAHTFDPNEEFRLRCLVDTIGVKRFVETVRNLPACKTFHAPTATARSQPDLLAAELATLKASQAVNLNSLLDAQARDRETLEEKHRAEVERLRAE